MAMPPRDKKGRFRKRGAKRRHTRAYTGYKKKGRSRPVRVAVSVNPKRHKSRRNPPRQVRHSRRRYGHNPSFQSIFSGSTLKQVGYGVAGFAGVPLVEGFATRFLPSTLLSNRWAGYLIKGAAAWGLGWGAGKVFGKEAGRSVLIGGLTYTGIVVIKDFFPTLLGTAAPAAPAVSGHGSQPLLGEYIYPGLGSPITESTPDRLDPASRF